MVPSDIKIGQQQLNVLAFADYIVLIVKMKQNYNFLQKWKTLLESYKYT